MEKLYTVNDLLGIFKPICRQTLYKDIQSGDLPALRIGKGYKFTESGIEKYCKKRGACFNQKSEVDDAKR